jgi:thiopeptide-type bacteriocin biosynthesis protein
MTGWRSWHLHLATFALDAVITDVLPPLADRLGLLEPDGPPWFFLRYWQGGPHLRVRLHGLDESAAVAVEAFLAERIRFLDTQVGPGQRLDQAGYDRAVGPIAAAGEAGAALSAGELLAPGVYRAVYEPEYERYGGRPLIGVTEELFHRSSQVALRVCLARAGTRHGFGSVLEATAAAASILAADQQVPFLTAQQEYWTSWAATDRRPAATAQQQLAALGPMAGQLHQALVGGDPRWAAWTGPLGAAFQRWTTELGPAAADRILGSHLHMTANRLGAGAEREAHVAALLLAILGSAPVNA